MIGRASWVILGGMTTAKKTEVLPAEEVGFAPVKFNATDATIAKMKNAYLLLHADGVDDKEGYSAVHEAHMLVKATVAGVKEAHARLKAPALEYGKVVDAEKKRLLAKLAPIAEHLKGQKDVVNAEKARIKAEKDAAKKAILDGRMAQLAALEVQMPPSEVEAMDIEEFEALLDEEQMHFDEREAARIELATQKAEEAARLRAEQEALAAERKAFEAEKAELEAAKQEPDPAEEEPEEEELEPGAEPAPDTPEEIEVYDILKAIAVSLSEIRIPAALGPEVGGQVVEIMATAASDVLQLGEAE